MEGLESLASLTVSETVTRKDNLASIKFFGAPQKRLFRGAYNRDAPGAVADFDPAQLFARFYIDNGDVV